jgi:Right handed beta helix region
MRQACSAAAVVFSLLAASLEANDYYVSRSGNDDQDGLSPATAWQTLAKINSVDFLPGDRISFEGGSTFSGELRLDENDVSTATKPIVITSYGIGRATIDAGDGRAFYAYNCGGFEVRNLNFTGSGAATNSSEGVLVYTDLPNNRKLEHVYFDRVDISGFGIVGLWISSNNGQAGYRDVRITYADVHDNGQDGMYTSAAWNGVSTELAHQNVYVGHSKFYNNAGLPGLNTGSGVYLKGVDGGVIEYCEAFNNGSTGGTDGGPVGIWALESNNILIQFNESHHNKTWSGVDGGGFDLDGGMTNSVLQYNYSHDNHGPGYLVVGGADWTKPSSNNVIRYNISENDGRHARRYGQGALAAYVGQASDVHFHDNTVFVNAQGVLNGTPAAVALGARDTTNLIFRNNLFVTADGVPLIAAGSSVNSSVLFQGNIYLSRNGPFAISWEKTSYDSLGAWRTATGQETDGNGRPLGVQMDPNAWFQP